MLDKDFDTFNSNFISYETLQTPCFFIIITKYMENRDLCFENITNADNLLLSLNSTSNHRLQ